MRCLFPQEQSICMAIKRGYKASPVPGLALHTFSLLHLHMLEMQKHIPLEQLLETC